VPNHDEEFVKIVNAVLFPSIVTYLEREIFNFPLTSATMESHNLKTIDGLQFTRKLGKQFGIAQPIKIDLMEIILKLLQVRSDSVCDNHAETNRQTRGYIDQSLEMKKSLYCLPNVTTSLLYRDLNEPIVNPFSQTHPNLDINKIHRMYLTDRASEDVNVDSWILFVIDFTDKKIYYIDPKGVINYDGDIQLIVKNHSKESIEASFNNFLNISWPDDNLGGFEVAKFPFLEFELQQNDFDSGIYLSTILYFLEMGCPIAFKESYLTHFRKNFAYWLSQGELPM
jgi:hypothetical protein